MAKNKSQQAVATPKPAADPLAALAPKRLFWRVGPFVVGTWVLAALAARPWVYIVAGVLTAAGAAALIWLLRFTGRTRQVAQLLQTANTAEGRKEALEKLQTDFKKGEASAVFARAQLLLQEPDGATRALAALQEIDLNKAMAPVADEARAQRAMIHLMIGETDAARALVDGIELSRHQQAKSRAMLAAIVAEAWARTGQAKKALDTLGVFEPEDPEFEELRPQLYRARAFTFASLNDTRAMRAALHRLMKINPQILGGFLTKKVHPLLQKEARQLLERSGIVPRKVVYKH